MKQPHFMRSDKWYLVDQNLHSLRRQLQLAKTEEDYQAVGVLSRETIISLGQAILDKRLRGQLPGVSKTDAEEILSRYFENKLPGSSTSELRSYSKACLKLAVSLQHMRKASYTQAELCTEACGHLVLLVRILYYKETAPPNERYRHSKSASAEGDFISSWVVANFDQHPVAKDHGFTFKGIMFNGPEIILQAERKDHKYVIPLYKPYWWRGANRISAETLIDEFIVRLLTELDKEHFKKTGQPPA